MPPSLTHVLKVCLAGTHESRAKQATLKGSRTGKPSARSEKTMSRGPSGPVGLFDRGPWERDLYDVFIAMQDMSVDAAVEMISAQALQPAVAFTPSVEQALQDFRLAAPSGWLWRMRITMPMSRPATARSRSWSRNTRCFSSVTNGNSLKRHAVPGVRSATARPGPQYREPGISFDIDIDVPSKVMLVDDENEFVHAFPSACRPAV